MIIALTGLKGSGKNAAGRAISTKFNFEMKAFVDPIREQIKQTFRLSSDDDYDMFKRQIHSVMGRRVNGRDIVKDWGMTVRRFNENFTLDYMNQFKNSDIVITDLRFPNEYQWCKSNGAVIIKIVDPTLPQDEDITELGFDNELCDHVIINKRNKTFFTHINRAVKSHIKTL